MKCDKCGANLTLEDVVCPHCEALNEHAVEHIREMNRYKSEFEDTREEVYSVAKSYAGFTSRIIAIAVLVVLTVVCGILSGEAYSIQGDIMHAKAVSNKEETRATLDAYLDNREYYAFVKYCDARNIRTYDEDFEEYTKVLYAAKQYAFFYDYLMRALNPYEGMDMQNNVNRIAEQIQGFYKIYNPEYGYYVGAEGLDYERAKQMEEQMHALLMAYCDLTKEDAEALATMSHAERTFLLEEKIIHED